MDQAQRESEKQQSQAPLGERMHELRKTNVVHDFSRQNRCEEKPGTLRRETLPVNFETLSADDYFRPPRGAFAFSALRDLPTCG